MQAGVHNFMAGTMIASLGWHMLCFHRCATHRLGQSIVSVYLGCCRPGDSVGAWQAAAATAAPSMPLLQQLRWHEQAQAFQACMLRQLQLEQTVSPSSQAAEHPPPAASCWGIGLCS